MHWPILSNRLVGKTASTDFHHTEIDPVCSRYRRKKLSAACSTILTGMLLLSGCTVQSRSATVPLEAASADKFIMQNNYSRLQRGVNVEGWFVGYDAESIRHFASYLSDSDIKLIKQLGFSHVRLPIEPYLIFDPNHPSQLRQGNLQYIDRAIQSFNRAGLMVIVDFHPYYSPKAYLHLPDFRQQLATNDDMLSRYTIFLNEFAKHIQRFGSDMLLIEPLNEPAFNNYVNNPAERWREVQDKLIGAIRQSGSRNTIVAKNYDEYFQLLVQLRPVDDKNVIYSLHFYDPLIFTHQGADWGDLTSYQELRHIPYPASAERCYATPVPNNQELASALKQYCDSKYGIERIEEQLLQAKRWADENNMKLYMGEFGVLKRVVNRNDRARWIRDVREVAERLEIPWAMFELNDEFGISQRSRDLSALDWDIVTALGLRLPKD